MTKNKTFQLFKTFSEEQQKAFFYFIKMNTTSVLFEKSYTYFQNHDTLVQEQFSKFVFGKHVAESQYRKHLSRFGSLILDFLAYKTLQQDTSQSKFLQIKGLADAKFTDWALTELEHLQQQALSPVLAYQTELLKFELQVQDKRLESTNLEQVLYQLDALYALEKAEHLITMASHQALFKKAYQDQNSEYLKALLLRAPDLPVYQLYYWALQLYEKNTIEVYQTYENRLLETLDGLLPNYQKTFLKVVINFAVRFNNQKQKGFDEKAFYWYRIGLEKGILMSNNILSPLAYRNAIVLAIETKNYEWANHSIYAYESYLEPMYQETYKGFCLAKLNFEQHKYKEAKRYLQQVHYEDALLSLNAKTMLLKIYYEEADWDSLEYLLESFKSYIQRKKVQGFYKTYFLKLVQVTKKLITHTKDTQVLKLKEEVENTPQMASKEWILEKINALIDVED